MWIMVLFDLPTDSEIARKAYTRFRKGLLKDGFNMMQYSVYTRHCASRENAEAHTQRVRAMLPPQGVVSIITITDKQFGEIKNFWGKKRKKNPPQPKQLEMF
ncbi:MAG: CRISPR-associated endonuclease Cas2 [Nitrospinales bacterium]